MLIGWGAGRRRVEQLSCLGGVVDTEGNGWETSRVEGCGDGLVTEMPWPFKLPSEAIFGRVVLIVGMAGGVKLRETARSQIPAGGA
jgi:hypothetical protein